MVQNYGIAATPVDCVLLQAFLTRFSLPYEATRDGVGDVVLALVTVSISYDSLVILIAAF